jgi:hypothetical protein
MRLESDRHRFALSLPRACHDVGQHPGVGTMHAVKVPHAQQRRAEAVWNLLEFVKNLHEKSRAASIRPKIWK